MSFIVQSAGTQSLIVDEGRPHSRGLGLPVGGAADRLSFALGNALVGNEPDAPALEIALAGPTLEATEAHAVAVFGAPFSIQVNDQPREVGKTFNVRPGDVISIRTTEARLRAYVCVPGGFRSPEIMGSRSALEPVRAGGRLECTPSTLRTRWLEANPYADDDPACLRVLPGSHAGQFRFADLLSESFTVKPESNRMGLRLSGKSLKPEPGDVNHPGQENEPTELLSAPVCPGTVQLIHDGLPIVLGIDAQTIGGYPRLAHVIAADVDKLGQLRPGQSVRFELVEPARAIDLFRRRRAWLREWSARLMNSRF
jgi:5-oxoprolinase (ATP-hydrolysing) subunit C